MSADPSHPAHPSSSQAGSSEGGRRPTGEEPAATPPDVPQRWSAQRKIEVVMRLLKGESIDALSRETQQTAAKLAEWCERFLTGAEASLKGRPEQDEQEAFREERRHLPPHALLRTRVAPSAPRGATRPSSHSPRVRS